MNNLILDRNFFFFLSLPHITRSLSLRFHPFSGVFAVVMKYACAERASSIKCALGLCDVMRCECIALAHPSMMAAAAVAAATDDDEHDDDDERVKLYYGSSSACIGCNQNQIKGLFDV